MNPEEIKSIIISDILKIEDYISFEETGTSKDDGVYSNMRLELLEHVHDMYVGFLLEYRTMGKAYPSVLEGLKYSNPKIINCIEDHKYEKRQELKRRRNMPAFFNYSKNRNEYCEACHQSPCMCSDREATSTVYDF